jgi:predicted Holliday junction resolvase-like endonuclease
MKKLRLDLVADCWQRFVVWFRRWGWVPIAIVLAILAFIAGGFIFRRRRDGRILDPLSDVRNAVEENNLRIDAEIIEAQLERDRQLAEIEARHRETLARLDEEQKKRAEQYRRDPKKLSRWLTNLARGK